MFQVKQIPQCVVFRVCFGDDAQLLPCTVYRSASGKMAE